MKETFEVNGIEYAQVIKEDNRQQSRMPGMMLSLLAPAMLFSRMTSGGGGYDRKLPRGTDIIKEYGLIQLKQSSLSKWEREAVVIIFERNYKPVTIK